MSENEDSNTDSADQYTYEDFLSDVESQLEDDANYENYEDQAEEYFLDAQNDAMQSMSEKIVDDFVENLLSGAYTGGS